MLTRLKRKIHDVCRYPALAYSAQDKRDLWLLGLTRNRLLKTGPASRFTRSGNLSITPRLALTKGERILLNLDHAGQIDSFDEIFFENIYDFTRIPFEPDLVLDCGGYCGYFSAMASGHFPAASRVCFEANPDNVPRLRAQLALLRNPVELKDMAVHTHDGTITFKGDGMGGAVQLSKSGTSDEREIKCMDFVHWLRTQNSKRLVWKLDVEGAEDLLLPACLPLLPEQTVCFLETHYNDDKCRELLEPYRAGGFVIHQIRRRNSNGGDYAYIEWLLVRERSAA